MTLKLLFHSLFWRDVHENNHWYDEHHDWDVSHTDDHQPFLESGVKKDFRS